MRHSIRLKRTLFGGILLTCTALLFMTAGTGLAVTDPVYVHDQIILRDASGAAIPSGGLQNAFSAKATCGYCHNGGTTPDGFDSNGQALLSYSQIEKHAYHSQLGANQWRGWNIIDPAKPWVQSPAHFGNW
ncbi:MAG: hypothetical protein AVO38_13695 [delta proteobacterium ML8_D]|nr:MAG: hypothetical protein AVO34_10195 [Firmicutes bacterium ML8_F2]OPL13276.1 MAG: hypothetical protein AVO38_13695 [delta proteobacterium ML8_D]